MDMSVIPLLLMFAVFYFLIMRPQIKESEAHDKLMAGLVKGDRVVTRAGVHGKIIRVEDDTVGIEIAKNTAVTLDKTAVVRKLGDDGPGAAKE